MNVFTYNNVDNRVEVNECELMLVKEFKALLERDKTKEKKKAFREFTYIFLAIDWKSVYCNYSEQEKHEEALNDSGLTEEEFNDPVFRAACRKYRAIQDSNKSIQLLTAARVTADKLIEYFTEIVEFDGPNARKEDGTPIYKAKDVIAEMSQISKVHELLKILEELVKKDLHEQSALRANAVEGFEPDF